VIDVDGNGESGESGEKLNLLLRHVSVFTAHVPVFYGMEYGKNG